MSCYKIGYFTGVLKNNVKCYVKKNLREVPWSSNRLQVSMVLEADKPSGMLVDHEKNS